MKAVLCSPKPPQPARTIDTMKTIILSPPANATREMKAAWRIYPDRQTGAMVHPQPQNREHILRLAGGGYFKDGNMELASRRQRSRIAEFNAILATI